MFCSNTLLIYQFIDVIPSLTAAQMWELVHILPFIIGKHMPPDDPHYACFMLLNVIATILFSPVIAPDQVPFLRLQI